MHRYDYMQAFSLCASQYICLVPQKQVLDNSNLDSNRQPYVLGNPNVPLTKNDFALAVKDVIIHA